jgi:hypothetical protein
MAQKQSPVSGRACFARSSVGNLVGWLLSRLRGECRPRPQLAVLERITLAPRQTLALIEASGQRLLVATSADGTPAFYAVRGRSGPDAMQCKGTRRVSW